MRGTVNIITGDCRATLAAMEPESVHCCVTSPPYFGLRDYGHDGQMGLEATPDDFVAGMVEVFREVRRVLRDDGTLWLNLGDSYASGRRKTRAPDAKLPKRGDASRPQDGLKPKDLIGIPWRVAFALQADGWYLRQDIIWHKPNPMPESVRDRCTKAHEYVFLLSKSARYYFDADSIMEPLAETSVARLSQDVESQIGSDRVPGKTNVNMKAVGKLSGDYAALSGRHDSNPHPSGGYVTGSGTRNKRSVWTVTTQPFKGAHFATFPPNLIEPCILAGCPEGGTVLDPFGGAGTTGLVAARHGRNAVLCELNPDYAAMARDRIDADTASPLERARRKAKPANDNDLFGVAV